MTFTKHPAIASSLALAVLASLAACGQQSSDETAGQKLDSAIERTGQAAREAKQDAREGLASAAATAREKTQQAGAAARDKARETADASKGATADARTSVMGAAGEAKQKAAGAAETAGNKADDTRISSSVKASIAADKELSAARIDVDTQDGVVTLSGAVPTAAAKARANEVARGIKDVKSVNNQLTLAAS
jgi:hyperosmotically inducible periplasmic protein